MKHAFIENLRMSNDNQARLQTINEIIEEYVDQGYRLTLRQLYYQLVSRDIVPNQQKEYKKLSSLLVKGRMAGYVDWDAIEDRLRKPFIPYWSNGKRDALNDTIEQYRLNRQRGQETYVELWVEKDALSGVLQPVTAEYHVRLMVNRGYSSCSAMYDAFNRFHGSGADRNVILYLGDHDPSGLDMIRDIQERLNEFGTSLEVRHIALTMEQIDEYNPPPNPAKVTDPRSGNYIDEFGAVSWEVDALDPPTLHELVRHNIESLIDLDLYLSVIDQEEDDKTTLRKLRGKL